MLMAAALVALAAISQVAFTGVGSHRVIAIAPERSTGIDTIYVVFDTQGVGMTYTPVTGEAVVWYNYDDSNWGYPDVISGVRHEGAVTVLDQVIPNKGYIIEEGANRYYCWVINYADYYLEFNDISFIDDLPCSVLGFSVDGFAPRIPYCSINGHTQVLDREITLSYDNLVWDDTDGWKAQPVVETFESLENDGIEIEPPLCSTIFLLSGDRFLREWEPIERVDTVESQPYNTQAVNCKTIAYYLDDTGNIVVDEEGNQQKLEGELTDGSAPIRILFTGKPTEEVVYRKWEIATDPDFEEVILQYNQDEVDYTFMDAGTYYVRYMVANAAGSCENYGDTYMINVSESQLGKGARGDIPNVFSPDVSQVWKVPHKSIVEFHCWIYNRWGTLLYEFTDPEGGWDGRYKGRMVDTGVYYYVVTATGSDGVKYKKRGDINILRYKGHDGTSGGATDGGVY